MLNNRKIRLMTKLARYEKGEGKEDIKLSKYYKTDYVRLNILKTIVATTVGYVLILLVVVLYQAEYLIEEAVRLDYAAIGKTVLGYYIALLVVYIALAAVGYMIRYNVSRRKLARYYRLLKKLRKLYRQERGEGEPQAAETAFLPDGAQIAAWMEEDEAILPEEESRL